MPQSQRVIKVYESGSGMWAKINPNHDGLSFTSDNASATEFEGIRDLHYAYTTFWEFRIHKGTMLAVSNGSNLNSWDCPTVSEFLRDLQESRNQQDDFF